MSIYHSSAVPIPGPSPTNCVGEGRNPLQSRIILIRQTPPSQLGGSSGRREERAQAGRGEGLPAQRAWGITVGGATHLARSAHAATALECSAEEYAYAQGFADGYCFSYGMVGEVTYCESGGKFSFACYEH